MTTTLEVTETVAIAAFDYSQLDQDVRPKIEQITREIRDLVQQDAFTRCQIGQRLCEVKAALEHGQWLNWLEAEFPWGDRQARYLMQVAEKFGSQIGTGFRFEAKALRMLAGESVPDEARNEAIAIAESGQTVTTSTAEAIITEYQPPLPEPEVETPAPKFTPSNAEPIATDVQEEPKTSPATYIQAAPPKPQKISPMQGLQDINAIEQIRIDELEKAVCALDDCLQQVINWCGDTIPSDLAEEAAKLHGDRMEMIG